jgi:predicted PurR-regulated permease PerM
MTDRADIIAQTRVQVLFWAAVIVSIVGFVWLFRDILLPFVLGTSIAYLLDPAVKKMRRRNIPRWAAALLILGSFALFVILILVFLMPLAYKEVAQLVEDAPALADRLNRFTQKYSHFAEQKFHINNLGNIQDALKSNLSTAMQGATGLVVSLAMGGKAILNVLYITVLTPIIAFLMMNDWPRMKRWMDDMVPRGSHEVVGELWHSIDSKLSGFIRGQLILSFLLGLFYSIALTVAGLNYGFLIGIVIGVGSLVPLVGSTTGLVTSLLVAWTQAHNFTYLAIIAVIFFVGQFVEANILTPRLLGKSVGLHSLWILFSLMAGAELLGIVGMLVAVPVAATIGVLVGYAISRYKHSAFYVPDHTSEPEGAVTGPAGVVIVEIGT